MEGGGAGWGWGGRDGEAGCNGGGGGLRGEGEVGFGSRLVGGGDDGEELARVDGVVGVSGRELVEFVVGAGVELLQALFELVDLGEVAVVRFVLVEVLVDSLGLVRDHFGDEGLEHGASVCGWEG